VNECWPLEPLVLLNVPEVLELLPPDALELPLIEGLKSVQGTATCFPDELLAEKSPELLLEDDELLPLDPLPDEESEITAKSILPEVGLIRTSLIVPMF